MSSTKRAVCDVVGNVAALFHRKQLIARRVEDEGRRLNGRQYVTDIAVDVGGPQRGRSRWCCRTTLHPRNRLMPPEVAEQTGCVSTGCERMEIITPALVERGLHACEPLRRKSLRVVGR